MVAGCASTPDPVLYPNAQLKRVGRSVAQYDINDCKRAARSYGVSETRDGNIAGSAAGGGLIGGAAGAGYGLVDGDMGNRALAGAAAGAAAGGARGVVKSWETSPVYKRFVEKCLRDRGYDVIGWQ